MNQQSSPHHQTHPAGAALHRCFYAVTFTPPVVAYLDAIIASLGRHGGGVRWVPARNIHLTLRYLGEITTAQLDHAMGMPEPGESFHPFSIRARGLGAFPLMRAPRVIWAGVEGETRTDTDRLLHLQSHTESMAVTLGLPRERRTYSPHITLGRVSPPFEGLKELIDDIIGRECQSEFCTVDELLLMRSRQSSAGVSYEAMKRWKL